MKIGTTILLTFTFIAILFGATLYYIKVQGEKKENRELSCASQTTVAELSQRFQRNFVAATMGLRGYLLTNEGSFLGVYDSAIADNRHVANKLGGLLPIGSEEHILLDDVIEIQEYWVSEFSAPLITAKESSDTTAQGQRSFNNEYKSKLSAGLDKDVYHTLQKKFQAINHPEIAQPKQQSASVSVVSLSFEKEITLLLATLLLGVGAAWWLGSYLSNRTRGVTRLAKAVAQGDPAALANNRGNDELAEIGGLLSDIALNIKNDQAKLRKQRIELDELTHILSHDVRLPLNDIQSTIYAIRSNPVNVSNQLLLNQIVEIERRASKAEEVVADVTTICIEGKRKRNRELVNIQDVIDEIRSYIPKEAPITLFTHGELPVIYAERSLVDQLFINMILNMVAYPSGESAEIVVYCTRHDHTYNFFAQHSIGTDHESQPYELRTDTRAMKRIADFDGADIGLPVLKELAAERALDVRMAIEENRKFVFCFIWPIK